LSFANDITVVAPPNEWPTIATLFKSNLPLKGKPVQLVTGIGDSNILNALEKKTAKSTTMTIFCTRQLQTKTNKQTSKTTAKNITLIFQGPPGESFKESFA